MLPNISKYLERYWYPATLGKSVGLKHWVYLKCCTFDLNNLYFAMKTTKTARFLLALLPLFFFLLNGCGPDQDDPDAAEPIDLTNIDWSKWQQGGLHVYSNDSLYVWIFAYDTLNSKTDKRDTVISGLRIFSKWAARGSRRPMGIWIAWAGWMYHYHHRI